MHTIYYVEQKSLIERRLAGEVKVGVGASMIDLSGRRVVILGASSGIGRALALHTLKAEADVLLCGRRENRLIEVQTEAGRGVVCPVDLADAGDIERLGDAAGRLQPVDAVVSTVGTAKLRLLSHMTAADWRTALETNVVGVNSAIRALIPAMGDGALVLALSSEAVTTPRWALAAYGASKAALEAALAGWRLEYPRVRFGSVAVGATIPTEFGRAFEGELLGQALAVWNSHGQVHEDFMDSDHLGQVLAGLLASLLPFPGVNMEHVVLRTPAPVTGSSKLMKGAAQSRAR
jgi:NADP-dependent 3-hydroxy acid dehydrogenase YdfG